jgi:cell division protein FtsW
MTPAATAVHERTAEPTPQGTRRGGSSAVFLLLGVVAILLIGGLVMVLSASSVEALRLYGNSWLFFQRQLLWVAIGTVAMLATIRIDYRRWRRFSVPMLVLSGGMLVLVLMPGLGISARGSSRWIGAGMFRIQPSEFAKFALVVFTADVLARRPDPRHDLPLVMRPVLVALGGLALLIMLQPDMGTTLVLSFTAFALLFAGSVPLRAMGALIAGLGAAALALGMHASYRRARLMSFIDPWKDAGNTGYQSVQSLVGLGTGNLTGVGLGASRAKWGFLPNAHTDFIFAIIGEELGLVGSLLVVALFAAFAVLGVRAALRAPDRFGSLVAAGITAWVVGQAILNIGTVSGLLPITGVPLPFVSFGGSSLVITLAAVGILLNVSRQGHRTP